MENDKSAKADPSGIHELKKVIEEELGQADKWDDYTEAFSPLTDGLGLGSPTKKDAVAPEPDASQPKIARAAVPDDAAARATAHEAQVQRVKQKFAVLGDRVEKKKAPAEVPPLPRQAPPLPPPSNSPSLARRVMAGIIDQIFVFTLWLLAMVITLKVLTGSFVGGSSSTGLLLEESRFLQFAVIEFATIWVAYAVFCMGLLDMTFGMWVWGIRVGYMTQSKRSWVLRKMVRTFLTFLFYAPVLPVLLLLIVGKRGRNLLDKLSGSVVYQSVIVD